MNRRHFITTAPAVAIPNVLAQAQDVATGAEGAVRAVLQRYVNAREANDSKGIESLLTPDADQLVSDGTWRKGRAALVKGLRGSDANNPAKRTIAVEGVRLVADDSAMADCRCVQEGRSGGMPRAMWTSITLRRGTDGWQIAAIRDMLPVAAPMVAAIPDDANPQVVLDEARALAEQGRYEEAFQRHLWFHENAIRLQPSMSGVRLSFALSCWVKLGERYPKAREALVAIRDRDVTILKVGAGIADKFSDVSSINGYLDEPSKTVDLFKFIDAAKPKLAERSYVYAEEPLVDAGEYTLCSRYISDPEERLRMNILSYEMLSKFETTRARDERLPKTAGRRFASSACRLIEILVAAGRRPEALKVQSRALEVRDDPGIRDAVRKAESMQKTP